MFITFVLFFVSVKVILQHKWRDEILAIMFSIAKQRCWSSNATCVSKWFRCTWNRVGLQYPRHKLYRRTSKSHRCHRNPGASKHVHFTGQSRSSNSAVVVRMARRFAPSECNFVESFAPLRPFRPHNGLICPRIRAKLLSGIMQLGDGVNLITCLLTGDTLLEGGL